jgi:hypothetical protein
MKIITTLLLAFALLGLTTAAQAADKLHHVVCLKFKSTATAQDIKQVEDAFRALKQKIPEVANLKWGTNISKEQRDKGFTHCFLLTFKNAKDRDTYLEHPEHKAFAKLVGPVLEDILVIDFKSKK